jgi:hypothetical protein
MNDSQDGEHLDLEDFRLMPGIRTQPKKRPLCHVRRNFLRGPIDWGWLVKAIALPGKALAVGLILWREAGIEKNRTIHVNHARFRKWGVKTGASRRALANLENAKLISVLRPSGRNLEVTILDCPDFNLQPKL